MKGGQCEECRKNTSLRQQPVAEPQIPDVVPPIVHEVLRSTGQPLGADTRSFMEQRFGHDFSRVRVHTDARAAESAQAVNAQAYTIGRHLFFDAGQYAPHSNAGQRLLAHELTHVLQQSTASGTTAARDSIGELEAHKNAELVHTTQPLSNRLSVNRGTLQRRGPNTSDADIARILKAAESARGKPDDNSLMETRGAEIINRMLQKYYPAHAAMVSGIVYDEKITGVQVSVSKTKIAIKVGKRFILGTDVKQLETRVQELGAELRRADQAQAAKAPPPAPAEVKPPASPAPTPLPAPDGLKQIRQQAKNALATGWTHSKSGDFPFFSQEPPLQIGNQWIPKVRPTKSSAPTFTSLYPDIGKHEEYALPSQGNTKCTAFLSVDKYWSGKLKAGEQEHIDDTMWAYALTWQTIGDKINALANVDLPPQSSEAAAIKFAEDALTKSLPTKLRLADLKPDTQTDKWGAISPNSVFNKLMSVTEVRDNGWHILRSQLDREDGCVKTYTFTKGSDKDIGPHLSEKLLKDAFNKWAG